MSGKRLSAAPIALAQGLNAWDGFRSTRMATRRGWKLMAEEKKPLRKGRPPAPGVENKRQFLATMDSDVIKSIKHAALEDETTASEILEIAAQQWLEKP